MRSFGKLEDIRTGTWRKGIAEAAFKGIAEFRIGSLDGIPKDPLECMHAIIPAYHLSGAL